MEERIAKLREEIRLLDIAYEEGKPLISDTEYEKKYAELKELEAAFGTTPDSPTRVIPFIKVNGLESVKHSEKILSLEKVNDIDALQKWYDKIGGTMLAQPKLDGCTAIFRFNNGVLIDAITRGDSETGQRILHHAQVIKSLPQKIPYTGFLEVRGEIFIPFAEFERFSKDYSNPRALTAGTLSLLVNSISAKRGLDCLIFDLIHADNHSFATDNEQMQFVKSLGFPVAETTVCSNWEELKTAVGHLHDIRNELPYPIDGAVIKVDEMAYRTVLGSSSKAPKFAVAYKYPSAEEFSRLLDVVWQIGRHGTLTPVACLSEIEIDGVVITRATLHNREFIAEHDIRLGDKLVVARANDVIPKVIRAVIEAREEELPHVQIPTECPICGADVVSRGPLDYCTGDDCRGKNIEKIIHFGSKNAMDIDGFGPVAVETLYNEGFVKDVTDLFELELLIPQLKELPGWGAASISKLLRGIERCKMQPLSRVLYSLTIPSLGRTVSKELAKRYSMETLREATIEELMQIEGIGSIIATDIVGWFTTEEANRILRDLESFGLNFQQEKSEVTGDSLKGKTIVITGTLSRPRAEYEAMIKAAGGKVSSSVSSKAILVAAPGETGTTKYQKAEKLGVPIIDESDLISMLRAAKV